MNKDKKTLLVWITAILLVFIAAYTFYNNYKNEQSTQKPPAQQDVKSTESDKSSQENQQSQKQLVPDLTLKDMKGNIVKLSDYRGKIVILNFWATWCKYCKQEMPDLNQLNSELSKKNDAVILAVDVQESPDLVQKFLDANKINLKVLLDEDGSAAQTYNIEGFPTTFIINKDGTLFTYIPGATDKRTLLSILRQIK